MLFKLAAMPITRGEEREKEKHTETVADDIKKRKKNALKCAQL
jgi:hypothetical protein